MNILERLAIFYRRLSDEPPASTADEAFMLICHVLEGVEDEYSSVPKANLPPLKFDGRMYAPQPDRIYRRADGSLWIEARRHRLLIESNGGITIYGETGIVEYRKAGA